MGNLLKVKDGNVFSINEAGNRQLTYYTGGDAVRSYWSNVNEGWVDVYLKDGTILLVNRAGAIMRRL